MSYFKNNIRPTSSDLNIVDTISQVINTGLNVVDVIDDVATGNLPRLIQDVPKTIESVVETTQQLVNNVGNIQPEVKKEIETQMNVKPNIINKLTDVVPIITTTQIPSSYASQFQNAPNTLSTKVIGFRGSKSAIEVSGSSFVINGAYHATSSTTLQNVYVNAFFVTGGGPFPVMFGTRVSTMASLYQFFYIEKVDIYYVPNQPTSQPGTFYIVALDGGQNASAFSPTIAQLSQIERFTAISGYTGGSFTYAPFDPYGRYYCSQETPGTDIRWYSPGTLSIFSIGNNQTSYSGLPGQFYCTFKIIFYGAVYENFDFNNKFTKTIFEHFLGQPLFLTREAYANFVFEAIDCLMSAVTTSTKIDNAEDYLKLTNKYLKDWINLKIGDDVFEEDPFNQGVVDNARSYAYKLLTKLREAYYALVPKLVLDKEFHNFLGNIITNEKTTENKKIIVLRRLKTADYFLITTLKNYVATYCEKTQWGYRDFSFNSDPLPPLKFPKTDNSIIFGGNNPIAPVTKPNVPQQTRSRSRSKTRAKSKSRSTSVKSRVRGGSKPRRGGRRKGSSVRVNKPKSVSIKT